MKWFNQKMDFARTEIISSIFINTSNEQRATSNEQRATSNEQRATSDKRRETRDAFTLTELMVAIFISSLVVLAISKFMIGQEKKGSWQISHTDSITNLRLIRDYMSRDILKAGYNSRGGYFNRIASASSILIELARDMNEDGDAADTDEFITYSYDGTNKKIQSKRRSSDSLKDLFENISSFEIKYYNDYFTESSATEVVNPNLNEDEILKIKVSVTALVKDPTVQNPSTYKTESIVFKIYPRNIL